MAEAMGDYSSEDDSVREEQEGKGLIKTPKSVPNEVSHRSTLEEGQALRGELVFIPDRVVEAPEGATPPPTSGGQTAPDCQSGARWGGDGSGSGGQREPPSHPESTWRGSQQCVPGGGRGVRCPEDAWASHRHSWVRSAERCFLIPGQIACFLKIH